MAHWLKADWLHPHNYPHTPTHYRHTNKHLRLVMAPIALNCTRQSRAPNIDRFAPENWPWPLTLNCDLDLDLDIWPWPLTLTLKQSNSDVKTRFLTFDHDLWPMTLTYNPNLHARYQGCKSNGSAVRVETDGWTDKCYQVHYLSSSLSYAVDN